MRNLVIAVGGLLITGFGLNAFFRERKKQAAPAPTPATPKVTSPIPEETPSFQPAGKS